MLNSWLKISLKIFEGTADWITCTGLVQLVYELECGVTWELSVSEVEEGSEGRESSEEAGSRGGGAVREWAEQVGVAELRLAVSCCRVSTISWYWLPSPARSPYRGWSLYNIIMHITWTYLA